MSDLISRRVISAWLYNMGHEKLSEYVLDEKRFPSEDRPTGEWIRWVVDIEDETGVSHIPHAKCSNCGTEQDSYTSQFINFCPNCGADMRDKNRSK